MHKFLLKYYNEFPDRMNNPFRWIFNRNIGGFYGSLLRINGEFIIVVLELNHAFFREGAISVLTIVNINNGLGYYIPSNAQNKKLCTPAKLKDLIYSNKLKRLKNLAICINSY